MMIVLFMTLSCAFLIFPTVLIEQSRLLSGEDYHSVKFLFHLKNKHIGNIVAIKVTGEKGQHNEWKMILFLNSNIEREAVPGYFHSGEKVRACITNFSQNSYLNCFNSIIAPSNNEANFYLVAAPS
jgi:hypothetical protein